MTEVIHAENKQTRAQLLEQLTHNPLYIAAGSNTCGVSNMIHDYNKIINALEEIDDEQPCCNPFRKHTKVKLS